TFSISAEAEEHDSVAESCHLFGHPRCGGLSPADSMLVDVLRCPGFVCLSGVNDQKRAFVLQRDARVIAQVLLPTLFRKRRLPLAAAYSAEMKNEALLIDRAAVTKCRGPLAVVEVFTSVDKRFIEQAHAIYHLPRGHRAVKRQPFPFIR